MTADELRNLATQARKTSAWQKAEERFRMIREEFPDSFNAWDGWGLAQALYKQHKYPQALDACRATYQLDPELGPNRNLYAWTIYQLEMKDDEAPLPQLEKAARGILKLVQQDDYSPAEAAVFKVADKLDDAPNPDGEKMISWLQMLDESLLSREASSFRTDASKVIAMASPLEKYLALLSKGYFEAERFDECIATCNQALKTVEPLHHGNNVWFPRRIAECHVAQKNWSEALAIYERITTQKRDWFLLKEMGDVLMQISGSGEAAMKAYARAWGEPGDVNMKVGLLEDWARGALVLGKEYAQELATISLQLKQHNGWRIDSAHLDLAGALGIEVDDLPSLPSDFKRKVSALADLHLSEENKRFEGHVINILPNLSAAFIEGSHGPGSIYCRGKEFAGGLSEDWLQARVEYATRPGFDKKKNTATTIAVRVKRMN